MRFYLEVVKRSIREFSDDHCPQLAAAISYHVLFSLFPLLIVGGAIFGIVVNASGVRADFVDTVVSNAPLDASGQRQLENLLKGATSGLSALGLLAIPPLLWAASGMMAALRLALRLAWDEDSPRPFLRGKAVDILLVIGVSLVGLLSVGLTVAARTVGNLTEDLGPVSVVSPWVEWTFAVAIPLVLSFLTVLFLYRVVPPAEVRLRDSWVPALFVATAFVLIQNLYAVYLQHFGNYNAIYGSLAAIVAFLFFIYVVSNVFLLGAELASEWPRTRLLLERGEVESEEGGREPLTKQAIGIIKGLVVRTDREETPEEGEKSEPEKTSPRRAG